jgi:hypothetical protein
VKATCAPDSEVASNGPVPVVVAVTSGRVVSTVVGIYSK